MKKMIFAMMIATGVLAAGFANAQDAVRQKTTVKNEKAKEVKAKNETNVKTDQVAKDTKVKQEKKKEAAVVKTKAKKGAAATK